MNANKRGKVNCNVDFFFFSSVDYENKNFWLEADAIWQVTAVSSSVPAEDSDL